MKTLVIHPYDPSTEFLSVIYKDHPEWTVMTDDLSKKTIIEAIKNHDHIIMMGHGSPYGLFDLLNNRLLIDSTYVYLLREKQCTCIWCDADQFVQKYKLKGLYTGMIISELAEAYDHCVVADPDDVSESNTMFAQAMSEAIQCTDPVFKFKSLYTLDTPVGEFNKERVFYE